MKNLFKIFLGIVAMSIAVGSSMADAAKKYEGETMQVFICITP